MDEENDHYISLMVEGQNGYQMLQMEGRDQISECQKHTEGKAFQFSLNTRDNNVFVISKNIWAQ